MGFLDVVLFAENVFSQRKYSSNVATKCQAAAIYDLLWIAVLNQIETVAHFKPFKTNLSQMKRSKGKVKVPKLSFIRIVDRSFHDIRIMMISMRILNQIRMVSMRILKKYSDCWKYFQRGREGWSHNFLPPRPQIVRNIRNSAQLSEISEICQKWPESAKFLKFFLNLFLGICKSNWRVVC